MIASSFFLANEISMLLLKKYCPPRESIAIGFSPSFRKQVLSHVATTYCRYKPKISDGSRKRHSLRPYEKIYLGCFRVLPTLGVLVLNILPLFFARAQFRNFQ